VVETVKCDQKVITASLFYLIIFFFFKQFLWALFINLLLLFSVIVRRKWLTRILWSFLSPLMHASLEFLFPTLVWFCVQSFALYGTSPMCSKIETLLIDWVKIDRARDKNTLLTLFQRIDSSNFLTEKLIHANV